MTKYAQNYWFRGEGVVGREVWLQTVTAFVHCLMLRLPFSSHEVYQYSQEQKTDEFKEKYKNRACQEWKNEEKNIHGLVRARGYGLISMSLQAKLTALAINLKRIAGILSCLNLSSTRKDFIYIKNLDKAPCFQVEPGNRAFLFLEIGVLFQRSRTCPLGPYSVLFNVTFYQIP